MDKYEQLTDEELADMARLLNKNANKNIKAYMHLIDGVDTEISSRQQKTQVQESPQNNLQLLTENG